MMSALKKISEKQANQTHNTESVITHFIDYAATNTSSIVQYKASDMILNIGRDASYFSEPW